MYAQKIIYLIIKCIWVSSVVFAVSVNPNHRKHSLYDPPCLSLECTYGCILKHSSPYSTHKLITFLLFRCTKLVSNLKPLPLGHWSSTDNSKRLESSLCLNLSNRISLTGFSSGHVWMWELDYKESWALKNWCFWTLVLEKTLESPLDCKEIQLVHPKGNQSWIFIGRTDANAETPILWPPDGKSCFIWKDPDTGKDWTWEE